MNNNKKLVELCNGHLGKMAGIQSVDSSSLCNPYCCKYSLDPDKVCSKCFSNALQKSRPGLPEKLARNTELLTQPIDFDDLPLFSTMFGRIESFGDVQSIIQAENYINICYKNPFVHFAAWTKNPAFYDKAFKKLGKPENLNMIVSSHYVNKVYSGIMYPWIDGIFTVYDATFAANNNISINCGGRFCMNCGKCYRKIDNTAGPVYINELLKSNQGIKYNALIETGKTASGMIYKKIHGIFSNVEMAIDKAHHALDCGSWEIISGLDAIYSFMDKAVTRKAIKEMLV